jgi:DNA-binding transcriptional MocR family regulator
MAALPIDVDRAGRTPLAAQIYQAIRRAIETGRLASGARLPSWRDLAAQLGVSRGTVRVAYQRLIDEPFRSSGKGGASGNQSGVDDGEGRSATRVPAAPRPIANEKPVVMQPLSSARPGRLPAFRCIARLAATLIPTVQSDDRL